MRTFFSNPCTTPVGQIKLAGLIDKTDSLFFESMRVFGSYAVVYLLEGSGIYFDANRYRQRLTAGDLLLLFPEIAHSYGPRPGETWKELYVVFDGPVFDLWRETGLLSSRQPVFRLEPIEEWAQKLGFLLLSEEKRRDEEGGDHLGDVCRFLSLLTEARIVGGAMTGDPYLESWLGEACRVLGSNLDQPLHSMNVAERVGLSHESFRKKFRSATGMGPTQYRTVKRIEAAQSLIKHTCLTNVEVAEQLGFCDAFHFAKRFKQITGTTPREYRRRHA